MVEHIEIVPKHTNFIVETYQRPAVHLAFVQCSVAGKPFLLVFSF